MELDSPKLTKTQDVLASFGLLTCFKSLKTYSLLLLDILDSNDISL
jgi:hypothetical protein